MLLIFTVVCYKYIIPASQSNHVSRDPSKGCIAVHTNYVFILSVLVVEWDPNPLGPGCVYNSGFPDLQVKQHIHLHVTMCSISTITRNK